MIKNRTTIFDRVLALVLCAVMVLGMMPAGAAATGSEFGRVSVISGEVSVAGNQTASVKANVTNATLDWAAADASIGRHQDGWWAGVLVTAPEGVAENAKLKYQVGETVREYNFAECKRSDDTVGLWVPVTVTDVERGATVSRTYYFDWNGDEVYEQTLEFTVNAGTLVLNKDGVKVAPLYATVDQISGSASIAGSGEKAMSASVSNATLEWVGENAEGRTEGWWAGILVSAPEGFAANAKLRYQVGETVREFDFETCKRPDNTVGLWLPVTTVEAETGATVARVYEFDWNGNGIYEQTLTFKVNAGTLTLMHNGVVVAPAYGTVKPLTPGTMNISGDGTANITAEITEAELNYVTAGNGKASWWVGIDMIAPDGADLTNAQYAYVDAEGNIGTGKKLALDGPNDMQLWFEVTPEFMMNDADGYLTMRYAFDWNGNGNFEQQVTFRLKISDQIVLKKDGVQVYPAYGTVTALTPNNMNITGNGTADVEIVAGEATLTWVEANAYRQAGWYAGIRAKAPATGFKAETATYSYTVDGTGKSFDAYKDGEDWIELWVLITEDKLLNDDDGFLTQTYFFNWNGKGGYEQKLTFKVKADGVTLLKDGKQVHPDLAGAVSSTVGTVNNSAVDVDGQTIVWDNGWKIVVTVTDPTDATKTQTIEIPFDAAGKANVDTEEHYDWDGNGHIDQTVTVTGEVTLEKAPEAAPEFDETNANVTTGAFYAGYTKAVVNAAGKGELTFGIEENDYLQVDAATGKVTVQAGKWSQFLTAANAGDIVVTVTATFAETDTHQVATASYNLTIGKNPDTGLKFAEENVTKIYGEKGDGFDFTQIPVPSENIKHTVTYVSSDTTVATVDADGKVAFVKAGTTTITATVTYDEKYTVSTASYTLTIKQGKQNDLVFGIPNPADQTYSYEGQFANAVTGGSGKGAVTYTISGDAATIDATTGTLTFVKAGEVTVTATKAGDDCYEAQTQTYTLTINPADQVVEQSKTKDTVVNSTETYDVAALLTPVEHKVSEKSFVYSITKDETMADTTIDGETGVLTIGALDYGTVTVKIDREGDEKFNAMAPLYFTLTVNELETDADKFVITGSKHEGAADADWFCGDVTIQYTTEGEYQVCLHDGHDWAASYALSVEGVNNIKLCVLKGEHDGSKHNQSVPTIKLDKTKPAASISYTKDVWGEVLETLTFGYYDAQMTVTITATDATSGLHAIHYSLDGEKWEKAEVSGNKDSFSFPIDPEFRNQVRYFAEDMAGNRCEMITGTTIVVDSVEPTREVTYDYARPEGSTEALSYTHNGIIYTQFDATAKIEITEDNFDLAIHADEDRNNFESAPVVKVDNNRLEKIWTNVEDTNKWFTEVELKGEGDYTLDVTFTDKSKKEMAPYSQKVHIDRTKPVIVLEETLDRSCTNENVVTTITITEHNFDPNNTVIKVSGENIVHEVVVPEYTYVVDWHSEGDVHTATVTLDKDAIYTLTVNATDLAGNVAEEASARFITEKTAPINVTFSYSKPVLGALIEGITFGYYQSHVEVTVSAEDMTSMVKSFELIYNRRDDACVEGHESNIGHVSDSNLETKSQIITVNDVDLFEYTNQAKTATATFTLTASELEQFFGSCSVIVTDWAGNATEVSPDDDDVIIVDNIDPVAGEIIYSEAKEVLEDELTVGDLVRPANTHYYDDEAVVTFTITEANFYGEEAGVTDNGVELDFDGQWVNKGGDVWENTVTLTKEGDHKLMLTYTDRSGNEMEPVESELIVIDRTNPVISLDVLNEGQRHYYTEDQKITVTIEEHNFRVEDVAFLIDSTNSSGENLNLARQTPNPLVTYGEWSHEGDVHTIELTFHQESNYTVDVTYLDLSKRSINDLPLQLLTVDKTAPTELTVEYSQALPSRVLDAITFGYYDAPVTVKISAKDETSGIREFIYSYIKHLGVSNVNTGLANQSITQDIKQEGNVFSAEFTIPQSALTANTQFNGYVDFTAIDNGSLTTSTDNRQKEDHTIIVDTISPTSVVTYSQHVQIRDDVAYYDGNIDVQIDINEANFVAHDVNVVVTKDGVNYPVNVNWRDLSVDAHTGTFTLTEDGDYIVRVNYTDRSNNTMATYTSQQMTIDTVIPEIQVSNVVNDSANADEVYSFDITASDTNFDITKFNPVLTALVRKEDGSFHEEKIDLGAMITVEEGKTYSYHVENLEADAIYFLSCSVTDLSNNSSNRIVLEDGMSYNLVRFSINRDGSTFMLGEYTQGLVNDYYTRNVTENLEIIEINADVLEEHKITLNGKELVEDADYTVKAEGGNGKWMQYTYTVSKALFEAEGEYQLVVSSMDKAGNHAFSDVKDATIGFVVDRTAPIVAVTGMANDGRYQTEVQTVTLIPTDDGGALKSLLVRLVSDEGEPMQVLIDLSGDALTEALDNGGGRLTFEIQQGLYQNVEIICEDCAVSAEGPNVYNELFKNLSVSTSSFMIFWANKPLRWGVIGGISALAVVVAFLLSKKKKRI